MKRPPNSVFGLREKGTKEIGAIEIGEKEQFHLYGTHEKDRRETKYW
jgi:hypothetical protein